MDNNLLQRLSGLSKRQLLDALSSIIGSERCIESAAVLSDFLDSIPKPIGSNKAVANDVTKEVEDIKHGSSSTTDFSLSK
jgi:hypothetical protein